MVAKLRASPAEMEHQVRPGMHRGELLHRDMSPDPEHRELPALVEQGIITE
jgi:hypothetical protein